MSTRTMRSLRVTASAPNAPRLTSLVTAEAWIFQEVNCSGALKEKTPFPAAIFNCGAKYAVSEKSVRTDTGGSPLGEPRVFGFGMPGITYSDFLSMASPRTAATEAGAAGMVSERSMAAPAAPMPMPPAKPPPPNMALFIFMPRRA